ncbi:DUF4175 family protein, partial [Gemmatimonadota bacterium]
MSAIYDRSGYAELLRVVRAVRFRWRLRIALRGLSIVLVGGLGAFLISTFFMDQLRYGSVAVTAFRVFALLALAGLVVRYLILPLSRRISDERVALYIEEHDPTLQATLLSAVELGGREDEAPAAGWSPDLIRGLVKVAVRKCHLAAYPETVGRRALNRAAGAFAITAAAAAVALLLSPPFLRQGARAMVPWNDAAASNPYSIAVAPGDTTLAKGADQRVEATLNGFDAERVEIAVKEADEEDWIRWPMIVDAVAGSYLYMFVDLEGDLDYQVFSSGVASDVYSITVKELPFVESMELVYHFPAYTGLSPQTVEDGGDIAAVRGTEVRFTVAPTLPVAGGRFQMDTGTQIPLSMNEDGTLSGALTVTENASYRVELDDVEEGNSYIASPEYLIDVLTDQPPVVRVSEPGRDTQVTSIEEVFTELEAEDDYGIADMELVFSVNGEEEQSISLLQGGARQEVSAGHTFFLEEYGLEPGDIISYYGRVRDGNTVE